MVKSFTKLNNEEKLQFWIHRCSEARMLIDKFIDRVNEQVVIDALDYVDHNEYGIAIDLVIDVMIDNDQLFTSDEIVEVIEFYKRIGLPQEKQILLRNALERSGRSKDLPT